MPTFTTAAEEQAAQRDAEIAAYNAERSRLNDERNRQANEQAGKAYRERQAREYQEQQQNEAAMAARELQGKVTAAELRVSQLQSAINNPEVREIERELAAAERSLAGRPLREATSNQVQHIVHMRVLASLGQARLDVLKAELANEQQHLASLKKSLASQTTAYEKAKSLLARLTS